ncbi:cytochrome aa3 quinol oxidase subunit II [Virgibacillus phasianinus]|uniref:Quinol oxidase subunit 2 n=1 Tax=Virgibacillus phasianinus TaxID=2017483 RepID=A0A220U6A2_9BACI|nr:cytochrome aa3 quinol oxidase subunit II [Virgibacillus phasianinus]ASK63834.1 cytochrome aa3 quinol oxidase subunit II [Virgibacillus phasianinus]
MNHKKHHYKKWLMFMLLGMIFFLSGCDQMTVFDPKGPVAESQSDLIMYSLYYMFGILIVVFVAFTVIVIKYRDRPNRKKDSYKPNIHGNKAIEVVWIVIPIIIVTLLSIPTVNTLFDLEDPPEVSNDKDPLVVYATSANWKWFFSYPEQGIETVNYLHIPTDRAVEFRLSSAGSMAALWIPALGGQKYNMAGMQTTLFLQADEPGVYDGRNANFNGEGFTEQTFKVYAEDSQEFQDWANKKKQSAPKLTQDVYDKLLKPGIVDRYTFSSTHLAWVDHGKMGGMDYAVDRYFNAYETLMHLETDNQEEIKDHIDGKQVK